MNNFSYKNSADVIFDSNVVSVVKGYIDDMKAHKILIVSGKKHSYTKAEELAKDISVFSEVLIFGGVETNPKEEVINSGIDYSKNFAPDLIITVGGGSVHDCGKAISVMLSNCDSSYLNDYTVTGKLSVPGIKKCIPIITIPTIVGSGAEVSPAALVKIGDEKKVIFSPLLYPKATIINLSYISDIPVSVLCRTAFDSFVQSIEGYISKNANPLSDSFALAASRNYFECIDSLKKNEITDCIIEKLSVASILSSYVCSVSGVGAVHALSDPLSGRFDIHHADALSMVIIEVLKRNMKATKADLDRFAKCINVDEKEISSSPEFILGEVEEIIDYWSLGVTKPLLDMLTIEKMATESNNPDMTGNPYDFTYEEIIEVFKSCFGFNQ